MVIGKIKPTATVVAQFAAGVEVDAIQHEGRIFMPILNMGEFGATEGAPVKTAAKAAKKAEPEVDADEEDEDGGTATDLYNEDDLMEMDTKKLVKILKDEFDVNPDETPGKNTNKKLRTLILDAQEAPVIAPAKEDEEDEEDVPAKKAKSKAKSKKSTEDEEADDEGDSGDLVSKVGDLLEDFDGGKKNKKKTISAISALSDEADEDKIVELVEGFEDDADADIDETAEKIAAVLEGKKSSKKGKESPKKGGKKEKLVDAVDLEVGDRVSVYWADENEDWFDGEVASIKKGKINIKYDDGTEDLIDPEIHTKIKLA